MRIRIQINCAGAAFKDSPDELRKILLQANQKVFKNPSTQSATLWLQDSNGNNCGVLEIEEDEYGHVRDLPESDPRFRAFLTRKESGEGWAGSIRVANADGVLFRVWSTGKWELWK